jgi:hypothetical protein
MPKVDWNPTMSVTNYGADDWGSDDECDLKCVLEAKPPWINMSWLPGKWLSIGIIIGYNVCRYMK